MSPSRRFTLLELLIVIAIMGILTTLALGALKAARVKAQRAAARAQLNAIKAALANYKADMGKYPRRSPRPAGNTDDADAYRDDAHALYAALRNRPTRESGGGPKGPYLSDWKPEFVGVLVGLASLEQGAMGSDEARPMATPLPAAERDLLNTLALQRNAQKGPGSSTPLVLLDPWGRPWHYREWASVRQSIKDHLSANPVARTNMKLAPDSDQRVVSQALDRPHTPDAYDLWSGGENGINEYGGEGSDDVCSWRSD